MGAPAIPESCAAKMRMVFGPYLPVDEPLVPLGKVSVHVELATDDDEGAWEAAIANIVGYALYNGLKAQPIGWSLMTEGTRVQLAVVTLA